MSILSDEESGLLMNADYSSMFRAGPAAALRCRLRFGFLLRSSLESVSIPSGMPCLKDTCRERSLLRFADFNCFRWSLNAFSATPLMSLNFFNGSGSEDSGDPQSTTSTGSRRPLTWTNTLIFGNGLVYAAQYLSKDKLTFWLSKRNCCISKGQWWRLVTCAFVHADIGHLLINSYSLSNVGPVNEDIWGPKRYLTIYISSAIAGSTMSYWFNKSHSVGASGAICGLVGSYVVYLLRNWDTIQGSDEHLKHIGKVILINLGCGLMFPGIDNWGHVGGFIGGAAVSCVVDPEWKLKPVIHDAIREVRKVIDVDREE